jgi:hypothetical protein
MRPGGNLPTDSSQEDEGSQSVFARFSNPSGKKRGKEAKEEEEWFLTAAVDRTLGPGLVFFTFSRKLFAAADLIAICSNMRDDGDYCSSWAGGHNGL